MSLLTNQLLLRGLVLLSAIILLGLGIAMATVSAAGVLLQVKLEIDKTTDLLKVPLSITRLNMAWLFSVVFLSGFGTISIGSLAVCAASGRRRVHSAAAALGAGAAAAFYLVGLLVAARARTAAIASALEAALARYFNAFRQTGDEKFLSQVHLQIGCCGLDSGPADFEAWRLPLPSSCCGQFTGNCSRAAARKEPCRRAVRLMIGTDGLFDLGYFVWILGVACAALAALLVLLLLASSGHTVELLVRLRQKTEEKWRQRQEKRFAAAEARAQAGGGQKKQQRQRQKLLDESKLLNKRDRELHRVLQKSREPRYGGGGGGGGGRGKLQLQHLLDEDVRQGGVSPADSGAAPRQQGPRGPGGTELERKLAREMELEQLRLQDRLKQSAQPPTSQQQQQRQQQQEVRTGGGGSKAEKLMNEKLRKEAETENRRVQRFLEDKTQQK